MTTALFRLRFSCALAALLLLGPVLRAQSVTIDLTAARLYDAAGVPLVPGSLVLLVADTSPSHNGFGDFLTGSSLSAGSLLNADDQILGFTTILSSPAGAALGSFSSIPLGSAPYTNLATDDPLALIWFSTLTGSSTTLTASDSYGLFTNASPTATVDGAPWFVPNAGATIDLNFKTIAAGGSHAETEAYATQIVSAIPEPATYAALLGLGALGLAAWRRFRRAARPRSNH